MKILREIRRAGTDCAVVGSRVFLHGDSAVNYRLFLDEAGKIEAAKEETGISV